MSIGSHPEAGRPAREPSGLIVQIQRSGDEKPLQFPAIIRNLAGGIVTLEVNNPWINLNWENLKGQGICLRLLAAGSDEVTDLRGTVTWARQTTQDGDRLNLGLKLSNSTASARKLLTDNIPHTEDIKGLWDRWEESRHLSNSASLSTKIGYTAVALLAAGLALQLMEPKAYKLLGWGLWFLGTMAVARQTLQYWRSR